jgi:lipopolysaccharide heptosyltransferase I
MSPTRFLLIRLGALGDIVHAIPLAAALREAFPAARIDWLVEAKHRAIVECVPVLSNRIAIDSRQPLATGERSPLGVIRRLRAVRYDVAFDAQGLLKSAFYARASGAARVVGFSREHLREPAARFFYTETVDPEAVAAAIASARGSAARDGVQPMLRRSMGKGLGSSIHVIDKTLALASAVGIARPSRSFPLNVGDSTATARTRAALGLDPDAPFVLTNPGAAWPNKRWPAERFGALARRIRERTGLRSAVLWGPGETALAGAVVAASEGAAVAAPETTVADIVALARDAALLVSGDTGPIHLAAAAGTPIIGIYGPTDPARNGPWDPRDVCVSRVDRCACHHQRRCLVADWCLAGVEVDEVWRAVARRMAWSE